MKTLKFNLRTLAMTVIVSLFLVSCNDEETYPSTYYYTTRATVTSVEGESLTLRTDEGDELTIVSDYSGYAPKRGQRSLITYSIENGDNGVYNASLATAYDILTKDVVELTANNESDMGNDPIHLYDTWCAGGYLNVNFVFNTSGNVTHYVNLVENTLVENPVDGEIYLEFKHNARGDNEHYSKKGTVCFNLERYKSGDNVLVFVVKFTEFDGVTVTKEIKYDFVNDTLLNSEEDELGSDFYE